MRDRLLRCRFLLLLFACFIVALTGCSAFSSAEDTASSPGPRVDLLRVGVTSDAPPMIYRIGDEIIGVEADLARALGKELGREVRFVELAWEDQIRALEQNRIDIIMSAMSITQVRSLRVAFSDPYMTGGLMALVHREDAERFAGPFAFIMAEERVAVQEATTGDYFVQKYMKKARREVYGTVTNAFEALQKRRVDVLVHDAPVVWQLAAEESSSGLVPAAARLTIEYYAWAVCLESHELLSQVNAALEKWKADGTLDRIMQTWISLAR